MITIREAKGEDIHEITTMYNDLLHIAYPNRKISALEFLYRQVTDWIIKNEFILVSHDDKIDRITGFILVRENNAGGLTEVILDAEITYVKPEHRKSRAAYLLYNTGFNYAKLRGLGIMSTSTEESSPIVTKRFGAKKSFNHFETSKEYINSINKENN